MAVRRPPAPRLQAGRPGVQPVPAAREQLAAEHAQSAQASQSAKSARSARSARTAQSAQSAQSAKPLATGAVSGTPRRRALLLAGSVAAALALPVTAGGLLARRGHDSPPAASSSGGGGTAIDADLTSPFSDVADGAEGLAAMLWAEETGVQPAPTGNTYDPDAPVTRGDLALALYRFAGSPELATEAAPALIADIGSDPLYARALLWLHGRGALWGDHELRVHPEAEATRRCAAQMVTALVRPALAGIGVSWDPATDSALPGLSEDEPSADEVHWLSAAGMLISAQQPEEAADWDGDQILTRAHLAIALHRVDEVIASAMG